MAEDRTAPPSGSRRFGRDSDGRERDQRRRMLVSRILQDFRRSDDRVAARRPLVDAAQAALGERSRPAT